MQGIVIVGVEQRLDAIDAGKVALEVFAPRLPALEGERRVQRIRTGVDPVPERISARFRESLLLQLAVFHRYDAPAHVLEKLVDATEQSVGNDRVKALAVVVDYPPHIVDVFLPALQKRFVHVAFVQLGIADQGNHSAFFQAFRRVLEADVISLTTKSEGGAQADEPVEYRHRPYPWYVMGGLCRPAPSRSILAGLVPNKYCGMTGARAV